MELESTELKDLEHKMSSLELAEIITIEMFEKLITLGSKFEFDYFCGNNLLIETIWNISLSEIEIIELRRQMTDLSFSDLSKIAQNLESCYAYYDEDPEIFSTYISQTTQQIQKVDTSGIFPKRFLDNKWLISFESSRSSWSDRTSLLKDYYFITRLLMHAQTNLGHQDQFGGTAFTACVRKGYSVWAIQMMDKQRGNIGHFVNLKDNFGRSGLYMAILCADNSILNRLGLNREENGAIKFLDDGRYKYEYKNGVFRNPEGVILDDMSIKLINTLNNGLGVQVPYVFISKGCLSEKEITNDITIISETIDFVRSVVSQTGRDISHIISVKQKLDTMQEKARDISITPFSR